MKFIDSHCHLSDARTSHLRNEWVAEAERLGIDFFMQGGVNPLDWEAQIELQTQFPNKIGLCFGLHPYWVAENETEACQIGLDQLARVIPKALALGELGLDFRPHIIKDSRERQIGIFEDQLELAQMAHKPVVLHLVQAFETALAVFDHFGVPSRAGLVHSFNGTWGEAEQYLQRGLFLSIGGPVARAKNKRLKEAVKRIPLEFLLLETDSPDQPPDKYFGQMNPLASLWEIAKTVAELKDLDALEILKVSKNNFQRLMNLEAI